MVPCIMRRWATVPSLIWGSVVKWPMTQSKYVRILRMFHLTILFWGEVKWVTEKFLGTKVPCTLGWPYTEGTWLYCDHFIWCASCAVVVLTCFVMCGCVCMLGFFWQLCGCFGNMCTCIYCVLYCLYCVFVLFCLCIFILICFVCTGVRTTATEWQLNCSK
jgi:hypothetical protein